MGIMKIGIKTRKERLVFLISFSAILIGLAGISHVIAYNSGQPQVHGHDANEIANLPAGVGSGGGLDDWDCQINSWESGAQSGSLDCPADYTLISGGCSIYTGTGSLEDLLHSYPDGNGWFCGSSIDTRHVKIYTYCCRGGGGSGSGGFGDWVDYGTDTTLQPAALTDGIVIAYKPSGTIYGYTDGVIRHLSEPDNAGFTMPVKKGETWQVTGPVSQIWWIPSGGGGSASEPSNTIVQVLTNGVEYQNTGQHKLIVVAWGNSVVGHQSINGYIGEASADTHVASDGGESARKSITFVVPVGWYYKVSLTSGGLTANAWEM